MAISVVTTISTYNAASGSTLDASTTLDVQVGDFLIAFTSCNGVVDSDIYSTDDSIHFDVRGAQTNWWNMSQDGGRFKVVTAATGVTIRADFGSSVSERELFVIQLRPSAGESLWFYDGFYRGSDTTTTPTSGTTDILGDSVYAVAYTACASTDSLTWSALSIGGVAADGDAQLLRSHAWWADVSGQHDDAVATATISASQDTFTDWMIVKSVPNGATSSSVRMYNDGTGILSRPDLPSGGFLFTTWVKPEVLTGDYPHERWNLTCFSANGGPSGTETVLECITHNGYLNSPYTGMLRNNANTMFGVTTRSDYGGDFNLLEEDGNLDPGRRVSETDFFDWHFYAAMYDIDGSNNVTLHQWLMPGRGARMRYVEANYGTGNPVISPPSGDPQPSDLERFWLGLRASNPATSYYCQTQTRIYARGSDDVPTISELEAIAYNSEADTSAWGDWEIAWESGTPVVTDRSGNSRDLVPETGGLYYEGDPFTLFPVTAVTYSVSYDANGGTGSQTDTNSPYEENDTVTVLSAGTMSRSGYTFSGWNTMSNGSGTAYTPSDTFSMPANNVTLYAQWTAIAETHTITYDANEGSNPPTDSTEYEADDTATILGESSMTRSGYTFIEWNTSSNGSGLSYIEYDTVTVLSDLTLYAIWAVTDTRPRYLGLNLFAGQIDWTSDRLFADVMKTAREWKEPGYYGNGALVNVDSNGWPTVDAECILWAGVGSMNGTYHIRGEADSDPTIGLGYGGGTVSNHTYLGGIFEADLVVSDTGTTGLLLTLTNTSGGVRNVTVMRPTTVGGATSYTVGTNFTDEALALVDDFDVVRFMFLIDGWNGAWQVSWDDRVQPDYCSFNRNTSTVVNGVYVGWAGTGAAWEYAIAYANETGKDAWINMPLGANDEYIRNLAQLWKDNYTVEGGHIYWEYSNEATWDMAGITSSWLQVMGAADPACTYDDTSDVNVLAGRYYGKRAAEMSLIWREVWGAEMLNTIRPCLCGQLTWEGELIWSTTFIRNWFGNEDGTHSAMSHPLDYLFWGCGGSHYSGDSPSLITDNVSEIDAFEVWEEEEATLALGFGLKRTFYEGGVWTDATHYTDNLIRSAMVRYHKLFEKYGGEVPMYYVSTGGEENGTALGFTLTSLNQSTRKYEATADLVATNRVLPYAGPLAPCSIPGADFSFASSVDHPAPGGEVTEGVVQFDQWRLWRVYLFRTSTSGDATITLNWTGTFSTEFVVDLDGEEIYRGAITSTTLVLPSKYTNSGLHGLRIGVVNTTVEYMGLNSIAVGWATTNQNYKLEIDPNGATSGAHWEKQWAEASDELTLPLNTVSLARLNYDLTGFNTAEDGTGTHYDLGDSYTMPSADTILFAEWTESGPPVEYTVTYDANGGTGAPTDSNSPYYETETVTVLSGSGLSRLGYSFANWNTEVGGTGTTFEPEDTFAMAAVDVVLYAQWVALPSYEVSFDANGAESGTVPPTLIVGVGQSETLPGNTGSLTLEGYALAGWSDGVSLFGLGSIYTPTESITLYAVWIEVGVYRIFKRTADSVYPREYGRGPNPGLFVEV